MKFALGAILLIASVSFSAPEKVYDQNLTWGPWDLTTTCSGVDFYYGLAKVPGIDDFHYARFRAVNHNDFAVAFRFKARFISAEGDNYVSPNLEGMGSLAANSDANPAQGLQWVPFKDVVSITRKDPLLIAQYGMQQFTLMPLNQLGQQANAPIQWPAPNCGDVLKPAPLTTANPLGELANPITAVIVYGPDYRSESTSTFSLSSNGKELIQHQIAKSTSNGKLSVDDRTVRYPLADVHTNIEEYYGSYLLNLDCNRESECISITSGNNSYTAGTSNIVVSSSALSQKIQAQIKTLTSKAVN